MASLTETAYGTKRFLLFFGIFILTAIVLKLSWDISSSFIPKTPPPPPPPPKPTFGFGKIPDLVLPQGATSSASFTYQIDTVSGVLPKLSPVAKVFPIQKTPITFLSQDRAKALAGKLGFDSEPQQVSEEEYVWQDQSLPRVLRMNYITQNFVIRYDLQKDASPTQGQNPLILGGAISEAQSFLQQTGLTQTDLSTPKTFFLKWEDGTLKEALGLSQAQVIRVDFLRQNIEDMPILSSKPNEAQISVLITANQEPKKKILAVNYTYWPVSPDNSATYPLKTVDEAYSQLKDGKGMVVSFSPTPTVLIREVSLAYFEPEAYQDYLQPMYVFAGDNNFSAYVSAVNQED